jgi:trimethylamine corrinoid protein
MTQEIFSVMAQSIMEGYAEQAEKFAGQALEGGIDPLDAINQGFILGLDKVGELFSAGEAFLLELVMAGEAMKAAVNTLEPEMAK